MAEVAAGKASIATPAKAPETPAPAQAVDATKNPPSTIADDDNPQFSNTAVLQGLNKVTGHISQLEGAIGTTLRFGNLEIVPRRCWKSAPEDRPENAVLLEIRELHAGEESKRIFLGWMFSSSPGLSGLEHAVYDINVLSCEYRVDSEKGVAATTPVAPSTDATTPAKKASTKHKKPVKQQN